MKKRTVSPRERMMLYMDHAAQAYFIRLQQRIHDLQRENKWLKEAIKEIQGTNQDLLNRLNATLKELGCAVRERDTNLHASGVMQIPTHHKSK